MKKSSLHTRLFWSARLFGSSEYVMSEAVQGIVGSSLAFYGLPYCKVIIQEERAHKHLQFDCVYQK